MADVPEQFKPWLELVDRVCREEDVTHPEVEFCQTPHAQWLAFHDGGRRIILPDPEWAVEYQPDLHKDARYGLIVLHELAHHIAYERHGLEGHSPFMYAKLFQLCVRHGIDLQFALEDEAAYKPRASKRGWALFVRWAQEAA